MDVFRWVPYLAIAEKRKDLLPPEPTKVDRKILKFVENHLPSVISGRADHSPVAPAVFFVEANLVSFSPSDIVRRRFAEHYATLSLRAFSSSNPILDKHYPPVRSVPVPEFLSIPRPFPELRLYHVEVEDGRVILDGLRSNLFRASVLFRDILRWLEEKVVPIVRSGVLDDLKDVAMKILTPRTNSRGKYPFIERLVGVSGLSDGRKRILYYWLIPYWITVQGKSVEEVLELANEWLSRQGGSRIYSSWIRSEAENVRSKGIKPWSLSKVERIDPELVRMLRGMGVL